MTDEVWDALHPSPHLTLEKNTARLERCSFGFVSDMRLFSGGGTPPLQEILKIGRRGELCSPVLTYDNRSFSGRRGSRCDSHYVFNLYNNICHQ